MRMPVILAANIVPFFPCRRKKVASELNNHCKLRFSCNVVKLSQGTPSTRRHILVCGASFVTILALNCILTPLRVQAENESNDQEQKDDGVVGAIKSMFDPNEKTKSGKVLPKAYLKSAERKTPKISQSSDGQQMQQRESYLELEKAIRSLASFYSKAGPSASIPEEVKSEILKDLDTAEEFL
ncbi:hypothetical protein K2173_022412 [Erythroxylum novogranatense]|uniref:Uncharacterized protein n=1 Tax=Erythroxylum novogranatense TaxID=1862640 RepID=A0AAV8TK80_9ROSI|nr:hypothetical protein K2173_022412 [Erythroxylum novogranatense]